jgi:preprotein translocase subunit SecA
MDYARSSVNLRSYGQREPLVEYKREALRLFRELEERYLGEVGEIMKHLESSDNTEESHPLVSLAVLRKADGTSFERNDKIILIKNGEEKEVKYKNIEKELIDGWSVKTETRKS